MVAAFRNWQLIDKEHIVTIKAPAGYYATPHVVNSVATAPTSPPRGATMLSAWTRHGMTVVLAATSPRSHSPQLSPRVRPWTS